MDIRKFVCSIGHKIEYSFESSFETNKHFNINMTKIIEKIVIFRIQE